jgi:type I restriction enzyme, S subunit
MTDLPPRWAKSTLGEVGQYLNGRGFKKSEWREAGRPIIRIQNLTGSSQHFNYFDGEPEDHYTARQGDVLVSWAATLGVFVWQGPEAVINQHIFKVHSHIDAAFHRYLLLSVLDDLRRETHGSGMVHITKTRFEQTPVAIPPLAEQRRIVAVIEEQMSRLDAAERLLADTHHRLRRLRSALLSSILDGPWPLVRIGNVASVGGGATPKRGHVGYWKDGTIPWVTSGQLTEPFVREPAALITEEALRGTSVKLWPKHTLLVALYGEGKTRGHCSELLIEATTNQACAAILLKDDSVDRAYVKLFFAASYDAHRRLASGGVQPNLSLGLIKNLTFPHPPIEEQRQIVTATEQRLSLGNALTEALDRALRRSSALRRSILEQAFAGRLVPQDPSDEPASVLLERITAKRSRQPVRRRRAAARV